VLVVVEPSIDSLEVAKRIKELANQIQIGDVWAILNKINSEEIADRLTARLNKEGINVIGSIRQSPEIFESCLEGRPLKEHGVAADVNKILDFLFP